MFDISPLVAAEFFASILLGGGALLAITVSRRDGRRSIAVYALPLIAMVAMGATAGSLYFSESAGFVPCEMCWIQRIAMYPTAVVAVVATARRDLTVLPYLTLLAALGLVAAGYHIGLQRFPDQASFCEVANPCTSRWVEAFGWITIPTMAAVSFGVILALGLTGINTESRTPQ